MQEGMSVPNFAHLHVSTREDLLQTLSDGADVVGMERISQANNTRFEYYN